MRWIGIVSAVFCCLSLGSIAAAQDTSWSRKSLIDLARFAVRINVSNDLLNAGIDSSAIQTDVELRLRQSGIPVAANSDDYYGPMLDIDLYGITSCSGNQFSVYAHIGVSRMFDAAAPTAKTTEYVYAECWSNGYIISIGNGRLGDLRGTVKDLTDRFLNAYLAANPKPPAVK